MMIMHPQVDYACAPAPPPHSTATFTIKQCFESAHSSCAEEVRQTTGAGVRPQRQCEAKGCRCPHFPPASVQDTAGRRRACRGYRHLCCICALVVCAVIGTGAVKGCTAEKNVRQPDCWQLQVPQHLLQRQRAASGDKDRAVLRQCECKALALQQAWLWSMASMAHAWVAANVCVLGK